VKPCEFQKGDRVDLGELRDGEVIGVGIASVWAVFKLPRTRVPFLKAAPAEDFRPHEPLPQVRIGRFTILTDIALPGRVIVASRTTGEAMETTVQRLEAKLAEFFMKEF